MPMAKSEADSKPVLTAEDVHIVTVYGRIYCLQVDKVAMLLHLYRFYRDAVVQQGSLPIHSSKVTVRVVDNVQLVHQVDAKVVILYDIFGDSRAPISAPLPMLIRGLLRTNSSSRSLSNENDSSETKDIQSEISVYGDDRTFLVPDLVCDFGKGLLWKIHLDLEASYLELVSFLLGFVQLLFNSFLHPFTFQAISASSSEAASMLEFLQRRKLEANKVARLELAPMLEFLHICSTIDVGFSGSSFICKWYTIVVIAIFPTICFICFFCTSLFFIALSHLFPAYYVVFNIFDSRFD